MGDDLFLFLVYMIITLSIFIGGKVIVVVFDFICDVLYKIEHNKKKTKLSKAMNRKIPNTEVTTTSVEFKHRAKIKKMGDIILENNPYPDCD